MMELFARAEEKTPYVLVALQECERMNGLTREMKRSLKEVDLGLKVYEMPYLYRIRDHTMVKLNPNSYS